MSDAGDLDRAARSMLREELAPLEKRIIDRFDWLEEQLHWINQRLEAIPEAHFHPTSTPREVDVVR